MLAPFEIEPTVIVAVTESLTTLPRASLTSILTVAAAFVVAAASGAAAGGGQEALAADQ